MSQKSKAAKQKFDYFLVLDFEATCEENNRSFPNEIIEFPTVLVDAKTLQTVAEFRQFVKPGLNPTVRKKLQIPNNLLTICQLTKFCTDLTGITQEQVNCGISLQECLKQYHVWLQEHKLIASESTPVPSTFF